MLFNTDDLHFCKNTLFQERVLIIQKHLGLCQKNIRKNIKKMKLMTMI